MRRLKFFILLFVFSVKLDAQTIEENFWVTNGTVWATAKDGNILYFGGIFTQVYRPRVGEAIVDRFTGDAYPNFPRVYNGVNPGIVYAVISDGNGGWYIGGNFTQVGNVARTNIVHILPDGSVDLSFLPNGANNIVRALAVDGNYLYVGGDFTNINGVARNRIARINLANGSVDLWNPNANSSVYSILPYGGVVYVGGTFTSIGGVTRNRLAALDVTTGNPTTWNPNVGNGAVMTMAIYPSTGTLFIGGTFTNIAGIVRNRIAGVSISTGAVTWYPAGGANNTVYSLAIGISYGDFLFVGGAFTTIGGIARNRLCAFNLSTPGIPLEPWNPNANAIVYSVYTMSMELYVGGAFTQISGQVRNRIAKFDFSTSVAVLTSWDPSAFNNTVFTLGGYNDRIYIGGNFGGINSRARSNLASIDLSTGNLTSWNPGTNNTVLAMHIAGGYLFIGGQFTNVAGQARTRLASFNLNDGSLTSWNPSASGDVRCFASSGSILYVGGAFTSITQGVNRTRNRLASFSIATGQLTSWNPSADGIVYSLFVYGNHLYVGGAFTTIDGLTRNRLAKFDITTGELLSWAPSANNAVWSILVQGSVVYVGGQFTTINGTARNYIASIDANTGALLSWNPNANNTVYSLAITGTTVYCGGAFTSIGGSTRNRLAGIDKNTGTATPWNPNANNIVYTLLLSIESGRVYVGGQFTQIMNFPNQSLASLTIPDIMEQQLVVGFAVSSISVVTGSTGNSVYVLLRWLDRTPPEQGVYSFTFEITSSSISVNSSNVFLHPSISGSFTMNKVNIPNGVRVTIVGNTFSSLLIDNGDYEGSYLVAILNFDAPLVDGTYYINLANVSPAEIRLVNPPHTSSFFGITDGYTTLEVISFTQFPISVPYFIPSGYTQSRKYGDINWDGNIDISDITSIADIVIENYLAVPVNDPVTGSRNFYGGGPNPNDYDGSNPDKADRRSADVYGSGGDGDPTNGEGDDIITQMDLAVVVDAVTSGAWPSYPGVISAIVGKPAFKIDEEHGREKLMILRKGESQANVFVKFEIFEPGDKSAKMRIKVINNEERLRGIQIELKTSILQRIDDIWKMPDAVGLNFVWTINQSNKLVILIYADGGKYFKAGESVLLTILIPGLTIEQLIEAEPVIISSVGNVSKIAMFEVSNANLNELPSEYRLYPNYPNPFNSETVVKFDLPEYSSVRLIIWDVLGRRVRTLIDGNVDPGHKVVSWDGRDDFGIQMTSGVYFITMFATSLDGGREFKGVRKILLIK